jgi:PAP2 superfamily
MRRAQDIALMRAPAAVLEEVLPLRLVDVILTSLGTLAAAYLLFFARWVPGWSASAATFTVIALGPPVLRWLARRRPHQRVFEIAASFWLLPSVIAAHFALEPLVDALHPRLLDPVLARADLRLFGVHPSVYLGQLAGPVLTEILMVCYYSYFVGPVVLAVLLYFWSDRAKYDEYALALCLFFISNFILYAAVPAVGPRYYLATLFAAPLHGLWLTPYLDGLMRTTVFARDCFPSGHTGVTLTVLIFAWRYKRPFFWIVLPVGTGLVLGTLVGRFHYGIDLLCAVPLVVVCVSTAAFFARYRPEGARVPAARGQRGYRSPART